jgi:hypothetical protein
VLPSPGRGGTVLSTIEVELVVACDDVEALVLPLVDVRRWAEAR